MATDHAALVAYLASNTQPMALFRANPTSSSSSRSSASALSNDSTVFMGTDVEPESSSDAESVTAKSPQTACTGIVVRGYNEDAEAAHERHRRPARWVQWLDSHRIPQALPGKVLRLDRFTSVDWHAVEIARILCKIDMPAHRSQAQLRRGMRTPASPTQRIGAVWSRDRLLIAVETLWPIAAATLEQVRDRLPTCAHCRGSKVLAQQYLDALDRFERQERVRGLVFRCTVCPTEYITRMVPTPSGPASDQRNWAVAFSRCMDLGACKSLPECQRRLDPQDGRLCKVDEADTVFEEELVLLHGTNFARYRPGGCWDWFLPVPVTATRVEWSSVVERFHPSIMELTDQFDRGAER